MCRGGSPNSSLRATSVDIHLALLTESSASFPVLMSSAHQVALSVAKKGGDRRPVPFQ